MDVILHSQTSTVHSSTLELLTLQVKFILLKVREMVMPGDNVTIEVTLMLQLHEQRFTFAIREGGRTVGAGQVTEIHRLRISYNIEV